MWPVQKLLMGTPSSLGDVRLVTSAETAQVPEQTDGARGEFASSRVEDEYVAFLRVSIKPTFACMCRRARPRDHGNRRGSSRSSLAV